MSFEWLKTTLGELCNRQKGSIQTGPFGSQLHASDYVQIGIPVVMPANIGLDGGISEDGIARITQQDADRLSQHKLQCGDVVFSRRGDVTRNALITPNQEGWLCGTGCLKVRLGDESTADAKFISYCLRLPETKEWLIRHAVGATMPNLNTTILSAVPISVPAIHEQKKITSLLLALDDRIALLRETNATLEAIAQALFKSWFVDFDPVHAKARGESPHGMNDATAALFSDSFEESELGMIPKGWRVQSFTQTINVIGGGTPKTSIAEYWNGDIPWFSVVDAPTTTDVFVIGTEKHITVAGLNHSSTKLLPVGTTIISARGTVGRLALVGTEMAMNQSCYGLRGKAGDAYFTYFSTYRLVETLKQRTHGSVFDTITRDTLTGVSVIYPTTAVINAFEEAIAPVMERLKENLKQAQTLAQLRDTLLPKLISGRVRLPEAEALLAEELP